MQSELPYLVNLPYSKDNSTAYEAMNKIRAISLEDNSAYAYMDNYFELLSSDSSYFRSRGLILIAANAKWDEGIKINSKIDFYLQHIIDQKPTTARQCIKLLLEIAKYKPGLKDAIISHLQSTDITSYNDSMAPLICKEIEASLRQIHSLK